MLDVHFPTDGRTLILSRYTQPEADQKILVALRNSTGLGGRKSLALGEREIPGVKFRGDTCGLGVGKLRGVSEPSVSRYLPATRLALPRESTGIAASWREVSESFVFRVGLFFFIPLRFCQGALAPQQFPPSRGVMGARSPHQIGSGRSPDA